ncbi:MAG: tRNA guanosine(34) transglycosylase Tgt [Rhizobiales bacterium]|nr:tRNA guanosine(34) transglycosylase Tgt [Hyphomicrobiales bacterium]
MADGFSYKVSATSGLARRGEISTPKGTIQTPAFMPVGTAATVKGMLPETVKETGADILLGNTYHLMLRPGAERVASLGGLHKFMNWDKPILTDSGGFQVMSLAKLRKITEEGVRFQSHIDGSSYNLTPERSMEIQALLGSDIQMAFDECTPFPATEAQAETSMELSMRWAKRSKQAFEKYSASGQALFGIVQGGVYEHLRIRSAEALKEIEFPGYAVGGLAVGEGQQAMFDTLDFTMPHLPQDKPRYLMGVGTPLDLVGAVERGVDMFDCVMPTRSGRHGQAFTFEGKVNLKNAQFKDDPAPLDEHSSCSAMRDYSKAYLHHLIRSGELLASMLVSWANIHFYQELMAAMRLAIEEDRFAEFAKEFRTRYQVSK